MPPSPEQAVGCRPHVRPVDRLVDLAALTHSVAARNRPAVLGGNPAVRGVSIFAAEPLETFTFCLHEMDPFDKLAACLGRYRLDADAAVTGDFCGGWIGFFGYELGRFIERLPGRTVDDIGLPTIRLAFYDKAILYDHRRRKLSFLAVEVEGTLPLEAKFAVLTDWLNEAQNLRPTLPVDARIETPDWAALTGTMTREQYAAALEKIHRHIIDGDVYQINYSQRFSTPFCVDPVNLFQWQNRCNPGPFAAYLAWDDTAVVSTSPELFLDVRGDVVTTRPIKGTRPRDAALNDDAPDNQARFAALVESEKEQAELAMIVDLERNDIAKVCVPGTRHVPCARRIEAFPTVYHAVATVTGTLAHPPGPGRVEALLRATFPGGSITGAPKIRAMEIIDALEPTARGIYTGCIGWIGLDYNLCLNIAIRTIIIRNGLAHVQVGGGIVADSHPRAEWDETLTKAGALLAGIRAVNEQVHI